MKESRTGHLEPSSNSGCLNRLRCTFDRKKRMRLRLPPFLLLVVVLSTSCTTTFTYRDVRMLREGESIETLRGGTITVGDVGKSHLVLQRSSDWTLPATSGYYLVGRATGKYEHLYIRRVDPRERVVEVQLVVEALLASGWTSIHHDIKIVREGESIETVYGHTIRMDSIGTDSLVFRRSSDWTLPAAKGHYSIGNKEYIDIRHVDPNEKTITIQMSSRTPAGPFDF